MRKFYEAYEYDFNNPRGNIVVHKSAGIVPGDEIVLVSIEGKEEDYDGFAIIVKVKDIKHTSREHMVVYTDYYDQWLQDQLN